MFLPKDKIKDNIKVSTESRLDLNLAEFLP